jgi:hypothetical protein
MIGLLQTLRSYEREVEADLLRYFRVDYLDRWRGGLSLRRSLVLVRALPVDSMLSRKIRPPAWQLEAHLLDDIRMQVAALTGKKARAHPQRTFSRPLQRMTRERRRRMADARRRAERRRGRFAQQSDG